MKVGLGDEFVGDEISYPVMWGDSNTHWYKGSLLNKESILESVWPHFFFSWRIMWVSSPGHPEGRMVIPIMDEKHRAP